MATPCLTYTEGVANGMSGVGVPGAADDPGLRVPGDVSVVGYDDSWFTRLRRLSLTTVDGHITEVGRVAGRTLTDRIAGERGPAGVRLLFPELVRRSSTGPVPPS